MLRGVFRTGDVVALVTSGAAFATDDATMATANGLIKVGRSNFCDL